jgi:7,8-dihydroneopterin aldolase/epimerase/oxygenase
MDKIFLSGLRLQAMVGIYPEERTSSRPVQIDLEIGVPGQRVFASGKVEDTIDYAAVAERIRVEAASVRFGLLEEMSQAIARIVVEQFGSPWVRVTIVKLGVLGDGINVGVSIERRAPRSARAKVAPRRSTVPVGPDYRMLMSGRIDDGDAAMQHVLAPTTVSPS